MFKIFRSKKGFSLIELIVVIAIIGVISAIAVPAVLSSFTSSKEKADVATAQAISSALKVAIVNLNSDSDKTNDVKSLAETPLSDLKTASADLDTELNTAIPGIDTKSLQSDPDATFSIKITSDSVWVVTFKVNKVNHSIDQNGKDTTSAVTE